MVVRLVKGMVLVMLVGLSTFSRAELSLQNGWLRLPPPGVLLDQALLDLLAPAHLFVERVAGLGDAA